LSLRLTFRAPARTLTDDEVQQTMDGVVEALERTHNARLR
jgi:phenylalanyl-tRNA synthetase beta subunit